MQTENTNTGHASDPNPESRKLIELLENLRTGPEIDALADDLREEVWDNIRRRIRRRRFHGMLLRYAAAAVVTVGVVCGSWLLGGLRTERRLVAEAQPVCITTPMGVKSDVLLPDGSRVQLNGGTRLVYPALFGDERRVEVDGEACFEVVADARRPFVVETGEIVSTVLGTVFNVHAYSEDDEYRITLASGSLKVSGNTGSRNLLLHPGEQGRYSKDARVLSLRRVDPDEELSWREGELHFRGETLESIVRDLERQFNVHIRIVDESLHRIRFTGEFVDGENIHEILRIISADRRIICRGGNDRFELYER